MKAKVGLQYFVSYCICKYFFDSNSHQTPLNLSYLTILVTLRSFCFKLKLEQLSGKKVQKLALRGNCFSALLTEAEVWY